MHGIIYLDTFFFEQQPPPPPLNALSESAFESPLSFMSLQGTCEVQFLA